MVQPVCRARIPAISARVPGRFWQETVNWVILAMMAPMTGRLEDGWNAIRGVYRRPRKVSFLLFASSSLRECRFPDPQKIFQISAQIFENTADTCQFNAILGIERPVLGCLDQQRFACYQGFPQFVPELLYGNFGRIPVVGRKIARSQHAKDLEFVPVGINIEFCDQL